MKKATSQIISSIMSASILASLLCASASALDKGNFPESNVPKTFTPGASITFDAEGNYKVTRIAKPAPISNGNGTEIGGLPTPEEQKIIDEENEKTIAKFDALPVYYYEQAYVAKEGAVAQYDQHGNLIRVRGDCDYYSTLDQYRVDGSLPDGKYVGTYFTFSEMTEDSDTKAGARIKSQSGRITTYGDYWPVIDRDKYPDCNTDPVPDSPKGPRNYGDRIGTKNNQLRIGDVALKKSTEVPYDTKVKVTIQESDTNGQGTLHKNMRVRDIMNEKSDSILDIWRWDSPEWFEGTPQRPDDLYFGHPYSETLSFENTNNSWSVI
ncbi:MAG: hypothetical protein Q4A63_02125 [Butyricicoccus pullicaecorum]|nr:hypothetical protein [Butyricicoccus pullicaecorum]